MGRGPRQDQSLSFSSPLRRQKLKEPEGWGESYYRFRLVDGKGEIHEETSVARDHLVEPFLWLAKGRSGQYQVVRSTALRDEQGDLSWYDRVVDNFPSRDCSYKTVEQIVAFLNQNPQGHVLEEETSGGEIILRHIYNRENSHGTGHGISMSRPVRSSPLNGVTLNQSDGEEALGQAYARMKAEVDQANLVDTQQLQEKYLDKLSRESKTEVGQEILDRVKADYEKAVLDVERKQEAFDDYIDAKEEVGDKLDDRARAKRAQQTIEGLRRS